MENPNIAEEKPVNKNRTLIIAVAVVVVLLCCCLIIGIAGFYFYTMSGSTEPVQSFPTLDSEEIDTPQFDIGIGDPPSGGLGNDILRNDVWQVMAPVAVGFGCDQPIGEDTIIEVLQQPNDAGVWVEQWTVMCASGDTYAFEVEFILDATGATFNIKPLP